MPDFNWNELNLTNRKYICLLAGIHESHAYLSHEEFSEKCALRKQTLHTGLHLQAPTGPRPLADTGFPTRMRIIGGWVDCFVSMG